jgi:glycosyltransferase involved in cell wall biosynthesis
MVKNKKKSAKNNLPFVSICTPTFNRRPFIPFMIKCFEHQTYPKDRMEWIIIDDGTDPVGDLLKDIPQVKYFYHEDKLVLGKKRNLMHSKCSGDIIIYMDDDDYYPPERVSHVVESLQKNPKILLAGSSEMYIYFDSRNEMYQFGPYGPNHATAATFGFRKELLLKTKYDDTKLFAEETSFTKGYSIPMVQLDPLKSILVFSHKHNTLNKEKLLVNPQQTKAQLSSYTVDTFIKDPVLKEFYMTNMNTLLENYEPGKPENKPNLMEEIKRVDEERKKKAEEQQAYIQTQQQLLNMYNTAGSNNQNAFVEALRIEYEQKLADKNLLINELLKKVKALSSEIELLKQTTIADI